jgi:hypothetical protein
MSFFSTLKRQMVACSSHLLSKARGWATSGGSGGRPCLDGEARVALNHLGGSGLQRNRRLGVEFQEVTGVVLYIGGSYVVMHRDSTAKSIPKLLLELAMFIRILAWIWKGGKFPIRF